MDLPDYLCGQVFVHFFTYSLAALRAEVPPFLFDRACLGVNVQLVYHEMMRNSLDLICGPSEDVSVLSEKIHHTSLTGPGK